MPRVAKSLVTDADCNGWFLHQAGYIPTTENTRLLTVTDITGRYRNTLLGNQTSQRLPSWDELGGQAPMALMNYYFDVYNTGANRKRFYIRYPDNNQYIADTAVTLYSSVNGFSSINVQVVCQGDTSGSSYVGLIVRNKSNVIMYDMQEFNPEWSYTFQLLSANAPYRIDAYVG